MRSRMSGSFGDDSVSPVAVSLSPMAATMHAGADALDALAPVGVHLEQPRHLLVLLQARVVDLVADRERARVDAQEDRLAPLVHRHLEGQRRQRQLVVGRPLDDLLRLSGRVPLTGGTSSGDGR